MKFKLTTSSYFANEEMKKKYKDLNLIIEKYNEYYIINSDNSSIIINTLEELLEFIKKYGEIVMNENTIEIYDNYRE